MKKILIFLCVMLSFAMVHAQRWEHLIGQPNRNEYGKNILEHYDYGYLISAVILQGSGNYHGWIVKTDINGEVLWDKQIGLLPDKSSLHGLRYDDEGNIYTFGWLHNQSFPHEFPCITKLNACGEKIWCRMFALDGYDYGFFNDAIILENGDLLCLAIMPEDDPSNNNRILLFRISSEGVFLWKKGYATHEDHPYYGDPYGETIKQINDQYIISGTVYSPYPNDPNPYHVWQRPMFIGIDEEFEEQWILEFGINDSLLGKAESVVAINDTLFMGVGRYRYFNELGIYSESAWLMLINHQGQQVGYKLLKDELGDEILGSYLFRIEQIEDNKYLLATGFMYDEEDNYANGEIIVDTAGNVFNYAIHENTRGGSIYLSNTFDNKYIFTTSHRFPGQNYDDTYYYKLNENLEQDTVYPGRYKYDSLCEEVIIQSGIIDLADCDVTVSIGELPTLEQYMQKMQGIPLQASPNPTNTGEVLLEMENTGLFPNLQLKVFDVFGNQIHNETVYPQQGAARLDTSQWPAGIYVATIFSNGQIKGKCKIVVEGR